MGNLAVKVSLSDTNITPFVAYNAWFGIWEQERPSSNNCQFGRLE